MRKAHLFLLSALLLVPSPGSAQRWTPDEQGLLDHVEACWDAWVETVYQQDLGPWFQKCQPAEDITSWDTSDGVLWDLDFQARNFPEWVTGVKRYWWQAIQPLEIRIYDDVGLIWFFVTLSIEDQNESVTRIQQKRFEVFRRDGNGWHWTGAMVAAERVGSPLEGE
jgi:hypothetical protein